MAGSKPTLSTSFCAAYLMAPHSNRIATLQLQELQGLARARPFGYHAPSRAAQWSVRTLDPESWQGVKSDQDPNNWEEDC